MQVVSAGGLHVVGTERHESRRIDNQVLLSHFGSRVAIEIWNIILHSKLPLLHLFITLFTYFYY